jgi:hypothetical protein
MAFNCLRHVQNVKNCKRSFFIIAIMTSFRHPSASLENFAMTSPDFFSEASLWVIKAACFASLVILIVKKLLKDLKS